MVNGIVLDGKIESLIQNNEFSNIESYGIKQGNNMNKSITIVNNNFKNVTIGTYLFEIYKSQVVFSGNTLNNTQYILSENQIPDFHNTAITIQNSVPTTKVGPFYVFNNTIINYRLGIHGENLRAFRVGLEPDPTGVTEGLPNANTIEYNLGANFSLSQHYLGIWLQNCANGRVISNTITNDLAMNGTDMFRGIDITASTNCRINCNTIDKIPRSIYFTGDCGRTKMRSNYFKNYEIAVELFDGNAILDDQGDWDLALQDWRPLNNEWEDDQIVSQFSRVLRNGIGGPISWYHDGQPKHVPLPSNTVFAIPTTQSCNCNCNNFNRDSDRDNSIGKVINDSVYFESNISENTYSAKFNVYQALKNDSSLVYEGNPNDVVYVSFLADMEGGNMGLFDSVNVLLNDSMQVVQAIALNNGVVDTNNVESYIKTVNEISLNTVEQNLPLSFADSATFQYISDQPFATVGIAKFMAAAHLRKEVHESSTYISNRTSVQPMLSAIHPINLAQVFPNPTFDKINFVINSDAEIKILIYDAQGKIVFTTTSIKKNYSLDCSYLLPGLYRYQIISNLFSDTGNFTIVR